MSIKWLLGPAGAGLALVLATSGPAAALGNLQVNIEGEAREQTVLVLTPAGKTAAVEADDDSDQAAGLWFWRNQQSGRHRLQVMRNGQPVGAPQLVEVADGETATYRVDSRTGTALAQETPRGVSYPRLNEPAVAGVA